MPELTQLVRAREALEAVNASGWESDLVKIYEEAVEKSQAKNVVYQRILAMTDGNPLGVELVRENLSQYVAIVPDAHHPGKFRCQYFDARGFSSHHTTETAIEALETAIDEGFCVEDTGAMDRLSQTADWKKGIRVASLIMACNSGQITWAAAMDAINKQSH